MKGNPNSGIQGIFDCGIRNRGPCNLEYSSKNPESHSNEIGIRNSSSTDKKIMVRKPVPGIQNPWGGSETVLDSLTWGELMA